MPLPVLLDTDIGTDVDDCLALALLLRSPELQPVGMTCVYGDVALRARMVHKLLTLAGVPEVPVRLGVREPLLGQRAVYWTGHEGVGLLDPGDVEQPLADEHAVDFLVRTVLDRPGAMHLVAIGPLTNVALALKREPRLATAVARLTIMGGAIRGADRLDLPYAEHNIASDPEAARIVLAAGAPVFLVPLDVTTQTRIRRPDVDRLVAAGSPFQQAVARQVELYPRFRDHGYTFLHDPLAVASLVWPELLQWQELHVDVELGGTHAAGATLFHQPTASAPANVHVAVQVDAPSFERQLIDRLCSTH
ncbi:MAG TPA: nucleoside hydrolase [Chloroflexota bacterium]|nr:nucleoside hydrolase [Chloroflexota bacterium]